MPCFCSPFLWGIPDSEILGCLGARDPRSQTCQIDFWSMLMPILTTFHPHIRGTVRVGLILRECYVWGNCLWHDKHAGKHGQSSKCSKPHMWLSWGYGWQSLKLMQLLGSQAHVWGYSIPTISFCCVSWGPCILLPFLLPIASLFSDYHLSRDEDNFLVPSTK